MAILIWIHECKGSWRTACGRFELYTFMKYRWWFLKDRQLDLVTSHASCKDGKTFAQDSADMDDLEKAVEVELTHVPFDPEVN